MGLKFVYNDTIYENFLTNANTLSSTWVRNAAAKLFCKGSTYYVPLYESKGENTLAYTDNSTIKQYVNTSSPTLTVYKDKKLYAPKKYSNGTYVHNSYFRKITYNGNSGSTPSTASTSAWTAINSSSVNMTVSSSTSRTGYNFSGWNTNSSGTGTSYTNGKSYSFSSNVTLYAIWKVINYSITYKMYIDYSYFKSFGGANSHKNPTSYNVETATITLSNPTLAPYYTFISWTKSSIAKGTTGNQSINCNITYNGPVITNVAISTSRTYVYSSSPYYSSGHWYKQHFYNTTVTVTATARGETIYGIKVETTVGDVSNPKTLTGTYSDAYTETLSFTIPYSQQQTGSYSVGVCALRSPYWALPESCGPSVYKSITINNVSIDQET